MNCKNCQHILEQHALFCDNCGAKVIKNRITLKFLLSELFGKVFGLDNKYFITLKKMFLAPQEVLNEYLIGVRKRYVNPFAYLAIGAGISLIVFSFFSDDFKIMMKSGGGVDFSETNTIVKEDLKDTKNISKKELETLKEEQHKAQITNKFLEKYSDFLLKYYNLVTFLFLPYYALLSKITFRKPHNYGEHIIMNAYLQGTTMYFSTVGFLISLTINVPLVFSLSVLFSIAYFSYAFKKLYQHSIKKTILKLLKFILLLVVTYITLIIIVMILMVIVIFILKFTNPELLKNIFEK